MPRHSRGDGARPRGGMHQCLPSLLQKVRSGLAGGGALASGSLGSAVCVLRLWRGERQAEVSRRVVLLYYENEIELLYTRAFAARPPEPPHPTRIWNRSGPSTSAAATPYAWLKNLETGLNCWTPSSAR